MMEIGMIGLGRMGGNMARRLARGGVRVVAYNRSDKGRTALRDEARVVLVESLAALVEALAPPRVVWSMLPAGAPTTETFAVLGQLARRGDTIVDGANAYYRDSMRHAADLDASGLAFVDAGVSGGVWGLEQGYALMLGGAAAAVERVVPFVQILAPAPDRGWLHCGPAGAGHFAKMIHNGIEYGLMQAYAEGFALLRAKPEFSIDVAALAQCWRHGSVVRSWLLELTADFLARDVDLEEVAPYVADSGEGRWTARESIELGVPAPVTTIALMMRFASQGQGDYAARLLAKMREAFGGHAIRGEPK